MTEQEWLSCQDPIAMLQFLGDRASLRKRQLFALACYEQARELSMARRMYESRDFADLPVLGDGPEEAGCLDEDVLGHCRQAGAIHARGCFVVDLLTGKS